MTEVGAPARAGAVVSSYDAIVVGAGHNGLVCAAYLARAGLRTIVLERRERVGGAAETNELLPGVRVPRLAHTCGRIRPQVAKDLALADHGLRLVATEARLFAPLPDGSAVTLWAAPDETAREVRRRSHDDGDRYLELDARIRRWSRFLAGLLDTVPPDVRSPSLGDAFAGLRLGLSFRGLGARDARELIRVLPSPVADFAADAVDDPGLQAAIASRGVSYASMGPRSPGTTAALLVDSAGTDGGVAGTTVYARGGPGALAESLAAAARSFGAEIRTGEEAMAVTSRDSRATGVALTSGEEIQARAVVSGLDPKRTLLGLVDPADLGPTLGWRTQNLRLAGSVAKVNLALSDVPLFPTAGGDARRLRGRIAITGGTIDSLERAFDASKYGRLSDEPFLEATIPSLVDHDLVAIGADAHHVMSVVVQWAPYRLREGSWDDAGVRDLLASRVLDRLESVAPGIRELVVAQEVLTPLDLEREYGLTEGHPLHGEPGLDQVFAWRPLLGWASYRMPLEGLWLCGSGAHPGGGITGGPGANAAREIVSTLKRRR